MILTEIQQGTPAISDSQPLAGLTRPESGTNLPGTSVSELDTPITPHENEKLKKLHNPLRPALWSRNWLYPIPLRG